MQSGRHEIAKPTNTTTSTNCADPFLGVAELTTTADVLAASDKGRAELPILELGSADCLHHLRPADECLHRMIDEMGLPYLRVSVTPDCSASCSFCHNEGMARGARGLSVVKRPTQLQIDDYHFIAGFFKRHFSRVKFTGGEPTIVSNLADVVQVFAREQYHCSMTTNGFGFDKDLQTRLRDVGLSGVNVSIHTTDEKDHSEIFGVGGQLPKVVKNLRTLRDIFPGAAKMQFMALPGRNVPSQLVPMTDLSAEVGLPVSYLSLVTDRNAEQPMSAEIVEYLDKQIGIVSLEAFPKAFCNRRVITFANGGTWEIDDFRETDYRQAAFNNAICRMCSKRSSCVEGPYALRIHADGTARPCLVRSDNQVAFRKGGYFLQEPK